MKLIRVRCGGCWAEKYYIGIGSVMLSSEEHQALEFDSMELAEGCASLIGGVVIVDTVKEDNEI